MPLQQRVRAAHSIGSSNSQIAITGGSRNTPVLEPNGMAKREENDADALG